MPKPKFTEQYCMDCEKAKPEPHLSLRKKTCQEGYGVRYDHDKICTVFVAGVWEPKMIKGATI